MLTGEPERQWIYMLFIDGGTGKNGISFCYIVYICKMVYRRHHRTYVEENIASFSAFILISTVQYRRIM
jgi:hypothetical protein